MKLFLDLDGVLADFGRGVHAMTGRHPEELPLKTMWAALSRAPRFFETLAFMQDAETLWRFCGPHRPTILTGLPLITCMSRDKARWSGPGHVLVDDRASAREGWERKGGAFVHHTAAGRSIAALRRLGFTGERPAAAPGTRGPEG
jgi:hypothetical protein